MIEHTTPAGGNVFGDIGFAPDEAEILLVCTKLMIEIETIVDQRGLNRSEAAALFGVAPTRITELKRGNLGAFTIDSLVRMLANAGFRVDVSVRPVPEGERARDQPERSERSPAA